MTGGHVAEFPAVRWQRNGWDHALPWVVLAAVYLPAGIAAALDGIAWLATINAVVLGWVGHNLHDINLARVIASRGGCKHPAHPSRLCGCTTRRRRQAAHAGRLHAAARAAAESWERAYLGARLREAADAGLIAPPRGVIPTPRRSLDDRTTGGHP